MIDALKKLTTIIMAGGKGERLFPLTRDKAKPAITFGGIYRIIDFTLSNCLNSGIRRIYVLTQYGSFSLDQHLRAAWDIMHPDLGEYIYSMPPQQIMVSRWYRGTADSIYQNLTLLQHERPEQVLILSGDHVYKMNYREMLDSHLSRDADLTVAAVPVPRAEAGSFGILKVDAEGAVENFLEKPAKPPGMPGSPDYSLASMGVYIFRARTLVEEIIKDAKKKAGKHDFGADIIPQMVGRKKVFAFNFADPDGTPRYWRDIGLLDAYYRAHHDLLGPHPHLRSLRRRLADALPAAALTPQPLYLPRRLPGGGRLPHRLGLHHRGHGEPGGALPRGHRGPRRRGGRGHPLARRGTRPRRHRQTAPSSKTASRSPPTSTSAPTPNKTPNASTSPKTASSSSPTTSSWKSRANWFKFTRKSPNLSF